MERSLKIFNWTDFYGLKGGCLPGTPRTRDMWYLINCGICFLGGRSTDDKFILWFGSNVKNGCAHKEFIMDTKHDGSEKICFWLWLLWVLIDAKIQGCVFFTHVAAGLEVSSCVLSHGALDAVPWIASQLRIKCLWLSWFNTAECFRRDKQNGMMNPTPQIAAKNKKWIGSSWTEPQVRGALAYSNQ